MFVKGSRYRNLPQSQKLNARGEHVLSVDLRFIPEVTGRFLHTVGERERLDLLGFKYYSDPQRWWLIADANPEFPFPVDLLDTRPITTEQFALTRSSYVERTGNLLLSLAALGQVGPASPDEPYLPVTQFFSTSVIVRYTAAATRPLIVDEIRRAGFRLLASAAWTEAGETAEQFTFEDPEAKEEWNDLVTTLSALPGVHQAESLLAGETLRVEYNTAQIQRATILAQMERRGFQIFPQRTRIEERTASRIVIPPNQAV